ncbi:Pkinase-domain-containing protein [Gloeophyllum trabeum ATCC 11539]|uniref:Serine/threonine-protein kinase n=1 Tax=Gloeophyllum trabeum (strain ATCC 11539 / FP-39264 / Madison 617) TaxID=670483 RepID=S7RDV2_GLOTA|nr:Pkinase-domain-containing protein [Gloeophyllum trabeum ATCC 11539]EPQ52390.1 Pkinase-domain-containing protein [Gloeophyllum trabeum ATCC 11539]
MTTPYYSGIPPAPTARRYPFSNAVNHIPRTTPPTKPQETPDDKIEQKQKEKYQKIGEPPLPRQNTKTIPPSPPKVIVDKGRASKYARVGLLGEGGFARVYEVVDHKHSRLACKVVTKTSLKTKKAKTKLYAEIKIHRALAHPNVVRFLDCFEDDENVYMTIELCPNGSLMDLLRRRKRFTEPEARFFMVQLLGACHYMHNHQVIHRDLKLGNLFLDSNMNIKVGDFGLAALIESPGERKKTICGTPNYIAPEVLFDTANGHSFEVDIWSIGVILYTFVIGHPPFQTKEVKSIYKRIRDNQYEFPVNRDISDDGKQLIQLILTPDPQERPTLHEILDHGFFVGGTVPLTLPTTIHDIIPKFDHITRPISTANLAKLRRLALLDEDQVSTISLPVANSTANGSKMKGNPTAALAQQEKEFQQAVQPGSPISALLKSARQPLVMGSGGRGESPLYRKLQAAAKEKRSSPLKQRTDALRDIEEERSGEGRGQKEKDYEEVRRKELEAQKARIVAQMAPPKAVTAAEFVQTLERENVDPIPKASREPRDKDEKEKTAGRDDKSGGPVLKVNGFDAAAETLAAALGLLAQGECFSDPREEAAMLEGRVFIASWVDYCNKYGMGYALTDGTVGVYFNDSTSLVLSPDKHHFDFIESRRGGSVYVRKYYTVDEYPDPELKNKVYLLKHFEGYIMNRLFGDYEYCFTDTTRTKGMAFLQKFLRMKNVIVFKMSNDTLQFNFYDHSKMILSSNGLVVTHIDKHYNMTKWKLSEIMARALGPKPEDPDEAKLQQRLVDKLKYCKEVLLSIRKATELTANQGEGAELKEVPEPAIVPRPSKRSAQPRA